MQYEYLFSKRAKTLNRIDCSAIRAALHILKFADLGGLYHIWPAVLGQGAIPAICYQIRLT